MRIPQDVLALLAGPTPPLPGTFNAFTTCIASPSPYSTAGWSGLSRFIVMQVGGTTPCSFSRATMVRRSESMEWSGTASGTDEEMLRVPLLLRLPTDELAGATGVGWASPLDATATILEAARVPPGGPNSGVSLRKLVGAERSVPLLSAGDGTEWNRPFTQALTPQRLSELNLFSIAAYSGPFKVVVDATTAHVRGYDLSSDPPTELPPSRLERPDLEGVVQQARQAAAMLMHPTSVSASAEVDERLRSWGYG